MSALRAMRIREQDTVQPIDDNQEIIKHQYFCYILLQALLCKTLNHLHVHKKISSLFSGIVSLENVNRLLAQPGIDKCMSV